MSLRIINEEILRYQKKDIQIVPGLSFNQDELIKKVYFYYNSKFASGDVDSEGDRKYFFNIVKNPCKVFSKAIDFDTKNIRLLTAGGGNTLKTWFMERDLKYWMRDKQFGKVLNRIFKELPIFGTVVIKMVNGTPYFVDLRNFIVEQTADSLDEMNYIIEVHYYTPASFRKVAKEMKWGEDKIKETLNKFYEMKDASHIKVYERYGEIAEGDEIDKKYTYKRIFYADVGVDEYDQKGNLIANASGVELSSEAWEGNPYWEFHAEKMSGRWLGIGVVETLVEPQIRENELANLEAKSSYWAALRLFFSRDPKMAGNLMTEKRNGDVITGDDAVTQIDMSDRNRAFFNQETNKWLQNRAELTFSYDVVQGERLPAGTPLGSAQISIAQTLSYFEGIQENVALDIKEMIYSAIIPQFEKENNAEHVIRLVGKDLDEFIAMVKQQVVAEEVVRLAIKSLQGSPFPTEKDKNTISIAVEENIKRNKEKLLKIPKSFYKDAKYDIDIDITGESVDTRVRYATRFALLQAVTADPTMTTDPIKKNILYGMAEDGGLNPDEIFGVERKGMEEMLPQMTRKGSGGGVSAPAMGDRVAGQVLETV